MTGFARLPLPWRAPLAPLRAGLAGLRRQPVWWLAGLLCLLGGLYWMVLASDRFVSQARIVIQRTDTPPLQSGDLLGGLLGTSAPGRSDQMLLREYLLSPELVARLDAALKIGDHYSQPEADLLSRMWWRQAPQEWLYRHYRTRVRIDYDEYSGVLVVDTQAYDPAMAQAITQWLIDDGERFMNQLAHRLTQAQVDFLQAQVLRYHEQMMAERAALLAFQDAQGLMSPRSAAESIGALMARLEVQLSELQVQRASLAAYLVSSHPQVLQADQQIAALQRQLQVERNRLAAPPGGRLNRTLETYQRLEAQANFAQDLYRASLAALEKGQMEANRQVKKVSALQAPVRPQYPQEPQRLYNAALFMVVVLLVAGIVQLLAAIVRDHRD